MKDLNGKDLNLEAFREFWNKYSATLRRLFAQFFKIFFYYNFPTKLILNFSQLYRLLLTKY